MWLADIVAADLGTDTSLITGGGYTALAGALVYVGKQLQGVMAAMQSGALVHRDIDHTLELAEKLLIETTRFHALQEQWYAQDQTEE